MSLPATKIISGTAGIPRIHRDSRAKLDRQQQQADQAAFAQRDREAKRLMLVSKLREMRKSDAWEPFVQQIFDRRERLLSALATGSFKDMAELARAQGQAAEINWVLEQLNGQERLIDETTQANQRKE